MSTRMTIVLLTIKHAQKAHKDMYGRLWKGQKKETIRGPNWSRMSLGRALSIKKGGAKVWKQWAECYNHTGYLGTLGKVEGGPLWTPHFCRALCSVTVPNETPRSCGSALLICGSGRLLGEIAVTASAAFPLQLPAKLLVAYWLRRCIAMFLRVRGRGFSPQEPRRSIIPLVTCSRLYRMDEKQREIKAILVLGAMHRL